MTYRKEISGLRGLSVLLIVLFHLDVEWLPGGFVGVDVFFVISGYLITRILVADIGKEGFSLSDFFLRRLKRIYPAFLAVAAAMLLAGWFIQSPGDYRVLSKSVVFGLAGLINLHFLTSFGYFSPVAESVPTLHIWSLSLELQFYLFWILAIFLFGRILRCGPVVLVVLSSLAAVVSFGACLYLLETRPIAAFYLPPARFWEFLAGALLGLGIPGGAPSTGRAAGITEAAFAAGIGLILWSAFTLDGTRPFPGFNALPAVLGSVLILAAIGRGSVLARGLRLEPLNSLGIVSYSLYLWHWPVIVFYRAYNNAAALGPADMAAVAALSIALAYMSWRWVEQPFRKSAMGRKAVLASGLAATLPIFALAWLVFSHQGFPGRLPMALQPLRSLDAMWEWACPQQVPFPGPGGLCAVGADWDGARSHALIWGDSHAQHLLPMLDAVGREKDVSIVYFPGCAPHLYDVKLSRASPSWLPDCRGMRDMGVDLLRSHPEIRTVILAAAYSLHAPYLYREEGEKMGIAPGAGHVREGLADLVPEIQREDRRIIVAGDLPHFRQDPVPCLIARESSLLRRGCPRDPFVPRGDYDRVQGLVDAQLRMLDRPDGRVSVFIPGDRLCDATACRAGIDGEFLYRDTNHIRRNLPKATTVRLADMLGLPQMLETGRP